MSDRHRRARSPYEPMKPRVRLCVPGLLYALTEFSGEYVEDLLGPNYERLELDHCLAHMEPEQRLNLMTDGQVYYRLCQTVQDIAQDLLRDGVVRMCAEREWIRRVERHPDLMDRPQIELFLETAGKTLFDAARLPKHVRRAVEHCITWHLEMLRLWLRQYAAQA